MTLSLLRCIARGLESLLEHSTKIEGPETKGKHYTVVKVRTEEQEGSILNFAFSSATRVSLKKLVG